MRKMMMLGGVLMLAGCGGYPDVPPTVTWSYGAGNGDSVSSGQATTYSYANGLGQDMKVPDGQAPKISRAYGADEIKGVTEQMAPSAAPSQLASPAPATPHPALAPAASSHL